MVGAGVIGTLSTEDGNADDDGKNNNKYNNCRLESIGRSTLMELSLKLKSEKTFLTHGYSVGVAVSYSWDFLICVKFCATTVIVLNPPACFARLVCI